MYSKNEQNLYNFQSLFMASDNMLIQIQFIIEPFVANVTLLFLVGTMDCNNVSFNILFQIELSLADQAPPGNQISILTNVVFSWKT